MPVRFGRNQLLTAMSQGGAPYTFRQPEWLVA